MSVRRISVVFVVVVLALVGTLLLTGAVPQSRAAQAAPATISGRTITVVGRGEVKVKPEIATTTVGVEALAPTVDAAMQDAKGRMDAVLAALKKLGVADKDIQTSNFSINFERQGPSVPMDTGSGTKAQSTQPAGVYRVSNMVTVTIRNLELVSDVLDTAVTAGANNVWGINFGLDDTSTLESQAREKAVQDARSRAESLAKLTGVAVGDVVAVSEIVGNVPGVMYSAEAKGMGGGGTPVEPGEVAFNTQIQVVYAIK